MGQEFAMGHRDAPSIGQVDRERPERCCSMDESKLFDGPDGALYSLVLA